MNNSILEAVAAAVQDADCVVALGGGADSAVLLWAAVKTLGARRVQAVFVHHDLEGSDMLRTSALAVSQSVGVECQIIDRPISDGGNLEARARTARYEAIEAVIPRASVGLTGHSADDQAETVLMRLLRGSGAGAISGIPASRGVWRRPLLGVSRASLRSMAEDLGLPFADDPANTDERFLRARIRHAVMPVIESQCGPDAKTLIRRSSNLLAADDSVLEAEAASVPLVSTAAGVSIPTGPLVSSSDPIASRVVRRSLRSMLDGYPGSAADVEAVLSVARGGDPTTISDALQVVREPPFVTIHRPTDTAPPDELTVRVGDSFNWAGSDYTTTISASLPPAIPGGRFTLLNAQAVGATFGIRGFRPGDRIDTGEGSTPVKEVLRTAGIPARMRPHSLTVTVDAKIAALSGVRVASWARAQRGVSAVIIEREVGTWT